MSWIVSQLNNKEYNEFCNNIARVVYNYDFKLKMTFKQFWKEKYSHLPYLLAWERFYLEGEEYNNCIKRWIKKYETDPRLRCKTT